MKRLFYIKIQPFSGHIPGDKVRVNNIAFESGFWDRIIDKELEEKWKGIRYTYKDVKRYVFDEIIDTINLRIMSFMKGKEALDPIQKQFYLNFNHDGIDCFVSRWNWKEKEEKYCMSCRYVEAQLTDNCKECRKPLHCKI